jgi:hypothetical protein
MRGIECALYENRTKRAATIQRHGRPCTPVNGSIFGVRTKGMSFGDRYTARSTHWSPPGFGAPAINDAITDEGCVASRNGYSEWPGKIQVLALNSVGVSKGIEMSKATRRFLGGELRKVAKSDSRQSARADLCKRPSQPHTLH